MVIKNTFTRHINNPNIPYYNVALVCDQCTIEAMKLVHLFVLCKPEEHCMTTIKSNPQ